MLKKELSLHKDEKLLREVCNLVEKPYLFLAKFRENYLKTSRRNFNNYNEKKSKIFSSLQFKIISYQIIFY